ncbi:MAG TPA: glycosyltransferase family 39 protein [Planctomycetota bacterium]|nr:glycosyltransferase family 39 protein [Planctomycetota bacterium]
MNDLHRPVISFRVALGALAAGVLLLRLAALWSSMQHVPVHDELTLVRLSTRIAVSGDLNPHFQAWGSLPIHSLAVLLHVGAWAGLQLEPIGPSSYLIARAASLLLCTGALVAIGAATARLVGARTGLLAAALLAVSPLHAELSRRAVVEPWMAFFFALAGLASVRAFQRGGRERDLALAGALCGLAMASKLTGGLALLQPLAAWALTSRRSARTAAVTVVAALGTWALASPFTWLDAPTFLAGVFGEARHYDSDHFLFPRVWVTSHVEYAHLLWRAVGPPALVAALLGLAVGLRRQPHALVLCIGAAAMHLVFVGAFRFYYERNLLVGLGAVAPLAALGVERAAAACARPGAARAALSAALALTVLGVPAWTSWGDWRELRLADTRTLAADWLARSLPPNANVLLESTLSQPVGRGDLRVQPIVSMGLAPNIDLEPHSNFAVLSSIVYGPILDHPEQLPDAAARYRELFASSRLVQRIEPGAGRSRGPTVLVLELGPGISDLPTVDADNGPTVRER